MKIIFSFLTHLNSKLTSGSCGCTVISFSKLNFLSQTHLCSCLSSIWKLSSDLLTCQLLSLLVTCTQYHQSPSEGPFTSVRSSPSTRSTWKERNYEKIETENQKTDSRAIVSLPSMHYASRASQCFITPRLEAECIRYAKHAEMG